MRLRVSLRNEERLQYVQLNIHPLVVRSRDLDPGTIARDGVRVTMRDLSDLQDYLRMSFPVSSCQGRSCTAGDWGLAC
jgi:hypothetical protein